MGFVFSGMTGGFLLSPFLAGIVYAKAGYFSVFILVFATLAFDLFLRTIIVERKIVAEYGIREVEWRPSEIEEDDENPHTIASPGLGFADDRPASSQGSLTACGDERERQTVHSQNKVAIIPRPLPWLTQSFPKMAVLLGSPRLSAAVYGCFTYMTIVGSFDATLPLFVKRTFGWDSQGVGLIFLALTAPALAGAAFGAASDRYGPRNVALSGFSLASLSLALLALIRDDSIAAKVGLAALLVTLGSDSLIFCYGRDD